MNSLQTEFIELLQTHVTELQINEHKATGHVPWREDVHPSLTADLEKCVWYDQARREGGGLKDFKARLGLNGTPQPARRIVARYNYKDEDGTLLYQVVRDENKKFMQRRPDGKKWVYNLNGVRRVLYRLPELLSQKTVWIVEGEKDAERLWSLGLPATCNPGGAGKWRDEYSQGLAGKHVVILPDNDEPGEQHAQHIARSVFPHAAAVRIVRLPGLPPKGDISDWLDAGHTREELRELVKATPALTHADVHPAPRLALTEPSTQPPSGAASADERAPAPSWPVLAPEALYGLAGKIVRTIDPYTEADPVAVLVTVLTMFGNCVGASPHFLVEHTKHHPRLFVTLVGKTAKGRKGQSFSTPRHLFEQIDPAWTRDRIASGLSSGEGLIHQVRDERYGVNKEGEQILVDAGEPDKRFLLVEEELAGPLKIMSREGNTLSAILRQAWDRGDLRPLTKTNPIRATGAHISIIGHITKEELLRHLTETEQSNGFGNRFAWFLVQRSKLIPRPKPVPEKELAPLIGQLQGAVDFARKTTEIDRDSEAEALWEKIYPDLSNGKPGLFGAMIGRAEVQTMRFACLPALLDSSRLIRIEHLKAGLALWEYAEQSAQIIFGHSLGDPIADEILAALRNNPSPLTRTDIRDVFGRHRKAQSISRALESLQRAGLARRETEQTDGRPVERWFSCDQSDQSDQSPEGRR